MAEHDNKNTTDEYFCAYFHEPKMKSKPKRIQRYWGRNNKK